jgi:hypothetical protein
MDIQFLLGFCGSLAAKDLPYFSSKGFPEYFGTFDLAVQL